MFLRLVFLLLILSSEADAASRCQTIFSVKNNGSEFNVIRLGYLPLEGRLASGQVNDNIWTVSILRTLENGGKAWDFRISTRDEVSYFEFPMPREILKKDSETQTTQNLSEPFLNFVYKQFTNELVKRDVFTKEFVETLKAEDRARLEENFTVWSALNPAGQIAATWGLYRHTEGEFSGKIELIRLASSKDSRFSIDQVLPYITEYLAATKTSEGTIVIRTDRLGARLYKRYGAQEVGRYDSEKKYVLEISVEQFIQRFPALKVENGGRPLRLVRFLDENFIH